MGMDCCRHLVAICCTNVLNSQDWKDWAGLNFYGCNDLGRNGYYDQEAHSQLMEWRCYWSRCVFATGAFYFEGVLAVSDPLWMTQLQVIYSHPNLVVRPSFPTLEIIMNTGVTSLELQ